MVAERSGFIEENQQNRAGPPRTDRPEESGRLCEGVQGHGAAHEFRFRTGQLLQRTHPEQSGMGICRGVRRLRDIRDGDGQTQRILKDARRLRGGQDQYHPDKIHQPLRKEHGRPSGDGQAFEVPRHRGAVREERLLYGKSSEECGKIGSLRKLLVFRWCLNL